MSASACRCYHSPRLGLLRCLPCTLVVLREQQAASDREETEARLARLALLPEPGVAA